jgi:hypothetical protein
MTWRATCGSKHVIAVYYWGTKIHSPTILGYQRYRGFDAYPRYLVVSNIFYFHFRYGMSSFPLTNSYFSRWLLHHQPDIARYIYIYYVICTFQDFIYIYIMLYWYFPGFQSVSGGGAVDSRLWILSHGSHGISSIGGKWPLSEWLGYRSTITHMFPSDYLRVT